MTTKMPVMPRPNFVWMGFGKNPIANETYNNISKYEIMTIPEFYALSKMMLS